MVQSFFGRENCDYCSLYFVWTGDTTIKREIIVQRLENLAGSSESESAKSGHMARSNQTAKLHAMVLNSLYNVCN